MKIQSKTNNDLKAKDMQNQQPPQPKQKWSKMYTAVLVANALYIVLFYFITASFA